MYDIHNKRVSPFLVDDFVFKVQSDHLLNDVRGMHRPAESTIDYLVEITVSDGLRAGLDTFVGYKPFTDTSIFVQWGVFWPGAAFPATTSDLSSRVLLTTSISF